MSDEPKGSFGRKMVQANAGKRGVGAESEDDSGSGSQSAPPAPDRSDVKLLELLVCPMTKTRLHYDRERQELISKAAGIAYPIRNGVPLMTLDAARDLNDDETA